MWKFSVKFSSGKCEAYDCKSIDGVRFLARMYLTTRKDIDKMLCFCDGDIWKWQRGNWEKKVCKE